MFERGQVSPVVHDCVAHPECGRPDVTGDVHPIRVVFGQFRDADMNVNVGIGRSGFNKQCRLVADLVDESLGRLRLGSAKKRRCRREVPHHRLLLVPRELLEFNQILERKIERIVDEYVAGREGALTIGGNLQL
jgi:hypothetical protein